MDKYVVVFVCFTLAQVLNAQPQDTIEIQQSFFGKKYYYNDNPIKKIFEFESVISSNDSAMIHYKKAKTFYWISQVLGAVGGFMIGFPIGYAITGNDAPWGLAAIGAGVMGSGLPFTFAFNNKMQKAVEAFNSGDFSMNLMRNLKFSIAFDY